jgi:hypothetical protein
VIEKAVMTMMQARLRTTVFRWPGAGASRWVPLAVASSLLVAAPLGAQEDARRLWDSQFLSRRQPSPSKPRPATAPEYRVAARQPAPGNAPAGPAGAAAAAGPAPSAGASAPAGELVGVTVWRLRPSKASDSSESRLLIQETESQRTETVEWTPERVEADTRFSAGDRVRLSIESPRAGYLYVIDREIYADGTASDPYLIFPTQRMRDGDNAVSAGRVIELPGRSAFKLTPLRSDYRGERLTILVTAEPLPQVAVPADVERLDPSLVAQWETQWAAAAERLELVGGAGRAYTGTERDAASQGRLLTQADELPQTLFRVLSSPGSPVVLSLTLGIAQ